MNDYTDDDFAAMALAVWARNCVFQAISMGEPTPDPGDHFPLEEWLVQLAGFKLRAASEINRQYDDPQVRMHKLQG